MTSFSEVASGRSLTVVGDSFNTTAALPNGDTVVRETGSAGRAYRAIDNAAGVDNAYLPRWGTSDYTLMMALRKGASGLNPDGFANYWAFACTDGAYGNARLSAYASAATTLTVAIEGAAGSFGAVPSGAFSLYALVIESANLAGGRVRVWRNGYPLTSSAAHGRVAPPTRSGTGAIFQRGGRNGANDFGVLNMDYVGKLAVFHRALTPVELMASARLLGMVA